MSEPRRPPPPFDVAIVTGFLGAGKTTLLNRLLRDPALADTLVLINEFGSVGIDHLLIEKVEGDMLLMSSGCLCCSIRGDLVATLEDVLRKRDNGRMAPFERLVIETTGLADPVPVLQSIMAHPYLALRFRVRAVVTLVDALVGDATIEDHEEAVKQVALADRLVLTKTDLAAQDDVVALRRRLRALNPAARLLDVGAADASVLFSGVAYDTALLGPEATAWLAAPLSDDHGHADDGHADDGHHHHDANRHDANRHDASIRAFCLRDPRPASGLAVSLFSELLRSTYGQRLLRFKGLIALDDDPGRPLVVHGVKHVMHAPERLEAWPDADRETRMVFILQNLDASVVEGLWRAAKGEPRVDEADLAARRDNPLAPPASGLLG